MTTISENVRRQVRRAREAERVARRVASEHPDPEARKVYASIADRAAARLLRLSGAPAASACTASLDPPVLGMKAGHQVDELPARSGSMRQR